MKLEKWHLKDVSHFQFNIKGRRMGKKRLFAILMSVLCMTVCMVTALTGCGKREKSTEKSDSHLTVYLWQNVLVKNLVPYIRQQFPDQDIEFIVGNNSIDLYNYLQEHGDLPDIITVRRFSQIDAKELQPYLLDFGAYNIVSKYYPYALQYYKNENRDIQWLPICGIPETTILNKTILDQYGLKIPENYSEYARLCQDLHDRGIKPYSLELADDWASQGLLQGAAIGPFTSFEGIEWRTQAENAQEEIQFNDILWKQIFSEVNTYIKDSFFSEEDLDCTLSDAKTAFIEGKTAMFHGTPEVFEVLNSAMDAELVRLPYFSQTSNESFCYISPSLNIAFNKNLENTPQKLDTAMKILECMISEEGQKLIAAGSGVVSFSVNAPSMMKDVTGLQSEIQENNFYIRYASKQSFPASYQAIYGLISGKLDEKQAYETFRNILNDSKKEEMIFSFEKEYLLTLNDKSGRDAPSSILTTVREKNHADAAIAPYYYFTSSIYKGPCTETQLELFTIKDSDTPLYLEKMSGADIKKMIGDYLTDTTHDYQVTNRYELPITSGMKIIVRQENTGFSLKNIEIDGKIMDDTKEYTLLFTSGIKDIFKKLYPDQKLLSLDKKTLSTEWTDAVKAGSQPSEPEDYITVEK